MVTVIPIVVDATQAIAALNAFKKAVDRTLSPTKVDDFKSKLSGVVSQVRTTGAIILNTLSQLSSGIGESAAAQVAQTVLQVASGVASIKLAAAQTATAFAAGNIGQAIALGAATGLLSAALIQNQIVAAQARAEARRANALRNRYR